MRKIKVVEVTGYQCCNDDYNGPTISSLAGFTDWEEVSDEDFEVIQFWVKHNKPLSYDQKLVLLEEKKPDYPKIIAEYLVIAREEKRRQEENELKKAEKEKIREKADQKRRAKLQAKKESKEKAIFEKLKAKFDS